VIVGSTLAKIFDYFTTDPLRLLTLIGGSGGFAYWVSLYRGRSRVVIRGFRERSAVSGSDPRPCIEFEAESHGKEPTSLQREVSMVGYTPKRQARGFVFRLRDQDRDLQPFQPKTVIAIGEQDNLFPFLWFKTYVVTPTRGQRRVLRIEAAGGAPMSLIPFVRKRLAFQWFRRSGLTTG